MQTQLLCKIRREHQQEQQCWIGLDSTIRNRIYNLMVLAVDREGGLTSSRFKTQIQMYSDIFSRFRLRFLSIWECGCTINKNKGKTYIGTEDESKYTKFLQGEHLRDRSKGKVDSLIWGMKRRKWDEVSIRWIQSY